MLSSEYGWTTEQIWQMTMREVGWRIESIIERKNLDRMFVAKINDKELKIPSIKKKKEVEVEITEDQQKAMEKAIAMAKERKAKEYGK